MKKVTFTKGIRLRLDAILALAKTNADFKNSFLENPEETLKAFAFTEREALDIAKKLGIDSASCCRLDTTPCGWTVCSGSTTKCIPDFGDERVNPAQVHIRETKIIK